MSARLPYNYKPSDGLLSTVWQVEICYPDKAPDPYETFAAFKDLAGWMERHNIEQAMLEVSVSDREYIDGKYRHMIKMEGGRATSGGCRYDNRSLDHHKHRR